MKTTAACLLLMLMCVINIVSSGILDRLWHRDPDWETLRITWGVNVARDHIFRKLPLREKKALDKGFVKLQPGAGCSGKFLGTRYYKPDDPTIAILYDHSGFFAGLQLRFAKPSTDAAAAIYQKSSYFIEEEVNGTHSYTLTAYLVEPDLICTTGRSEADYNRQKAGTALRLQNGMNPLRDFIRVPHYENETSAANWVKGSCFVSMGTHYWYNTSKTMECDDLQPMFLVFNHGKLTGFGWALRANVETSKSFEHPDKDNLDRFFDPVPRCLKDGYEKQGGFTMLHVYMNAKPWNLVC